MQVNECKRIKKSYQKPQNSLCKSPHFSFGPLYVTHQKMHDIIPVWEQNPIQLDVTPILSHNCLIFLSNSIFQDKPVQMYLTFSRCKGLSRLQAHIPEDWNWKYWKYFAFTPSSRYDSKSPSPRGAHMGQDSHLDGSRKYFPKARNSNRARGHN